MVGGLHFWSTVQGSFGLVQQLFGQVLENRGGIRRTFCLTVKPTLTLEVSQSQRYCRCRAYFFLRHLE